MKTTHFSCAALAALLLAASAVASDLTGSWKTIDHHDGKRTDILDIVKFETKDGHLVGKVEGIDRMSLKIRNEDFAVTNVNFNDGILTFNLTRDLKQLASEQVHPMGHGAAVVTREVDDVTRVSKYEARLEGDTLKGTVERIARNGKPHKSEWSAKLLK